MGRSRLNGQGCWLKGLYLNCDSEVVIPKAIRELLVRLKYGEQESGKCDGR